MCISEFGMNHRMESSTHQDPLLNAPRSYSRSRACRFLMEWLASAVRGVGQTLQEFQAIFLAQASQSTYSGFIIEAL